MHLPKIGRRGALLGLTSAITLLGKHGGVSLALAAAATDRRFVVIIQRGAMDGMAAVVPYGDPALMGLRAPLVPPQPGQPGGMLDLGGFYGLHPALTGLHDLYRAGELLPVHAVAGPYHTRSHFEAQDYMESGADRRMTSGWLNRAVLALPPRHVPAGDALAIGLTVPLLLRGPATVGNWAPQSFAKPQPDLYARIAALHAPDPATGPAIAEGLRERGFSAEALAGDEPLPGPERNGFAALCTAAGQMLHRPDGPRIAAIDIGGWDTHAGQDQRLVPPLRQLDAGLVALKSALGEDWKSTAVLVMTEFGRTARINGTGGTDHGTATVAFIAGGSVAGGRVLADWPGLGAGKLYQDRDLAPTTDLRAIAKGLLTAHLSLPVPAMATVFPDSAEASTRSGLLRA